MLFTFLYSKKNHNHHHLHEMDGYMRKIKKIVCVHFCSYARETFWIYIIGYGTNDLWNFSVYFEIKREEKEDEDQNAYTLNVHTNIRRSTQISKRNFILIHVMIINYESNAHPFTIFFLLFPYIWIHKRWIWLQNDSQRWLFCDELWDLWN